MTAAATGVGGGGAAPTSDLDTAAEMWQRHAAQQKAEMRLRNMATDSFTVCPLITFVSLIIINSLAWAGVMEGTATAITNISLITLSTIPKLCLAGTMKKEDESYTRKCIVIAALFILAMNVLVNSFTMTGHIPGEILGKTMVGLSAYYIVDYCGNLGALGAYKS